MLHIFNNDRVGLHHPAPLFQSRPQYSFSEAGFLPWLEQQDVVDNFPQKRKKAQGSIKPCAFLFSSPKPLSIKLLIQIN
jgi:hypothetical protein